MHARVLVVEDEERIRDLLRRYLEREGLQVTTTGSGADALGIVDAADPDLVVLDLGLPDVSGLDVIRALRRDHMTPVLVLTARSAEEDRIRGLELGADDYVTKPFSPREVVLRVLAILRRGSGGNASDPVSFGGGALVVDADHHEVRVGGTPVEMTATEWGLLLALASTPGRVYSRYELITRVRGYEFDGYERTIDSHVKNLRRKLEAGAGGHRFVETVVGVGYRLGVRRDSR